MPNEKYEDTTRKNKELQLGEKDIRLIRKERRRKTMQKTESLEKIPFEGSYEGRKSNFVKSANQAIKNEPSRTFSVAAKGCLCTFYDVDFEENGMDALVDMVVAFLYVVEHNDIDLELQGATEWYIEMFENGDYDDLFEEEDLQMLKEDITIVKKYLKEHPTD